MKRIDFSYYAFIVLGGLAFWLPWVIVDSLVGPDFGPTSILALMVFAPLSAGMVTYTWYKSRAGEERHFLSAIYIGILGPYMVTLLLSFFRIGTIGIGAHPTSIAGYLFAASVLLVSNPLTELAYSGMLPAFAFNLLVSTVLGFAFSFKKR